MKRIASFLLLFVLAFVVNAQIAEVQKHEVQSGETLYSIARKYNLTVMSLLQANPGVQADNIMTGQTIYVPIGTQSGNVVSATSSSSAQGMPNRPLYKTTHEVQKKETIYSLSRQYGVTEEQLIEANPELQKGKLKKGEIINIPYTTEENNRFQEERRQYEEEQKRQAQKLATIKVAIILPFALAEKNMTVESQKMTNLYQGFLLAVDSLKQRGCSVEVYAYDEVGAASIASILQKPEMKEMKLIVGPVRQWNVTAVANYAHEQGIVHVVPLSNETTLVNEHPTTFQVNVSYPSMYSQVYNRFTILHKNDNIIFVDMNDKSDNKAYVAGLKKDLETKGIKYSQGTSADFSTVHSQLKTGVCNVIVPSSGSTIAFEHLCKRLDNLNLSEYTVQLFGYPEWQTLPSKYDKYMAKYQCQFFTAFYSNSASSRIQQFNARFKRWFNQDQYNSIPKYGELGYDIGAYFIKGLHDYGTAFRENLHSYSYFSLEFPMHFEKRNAWSGYQNKSILIVTNRSDGTIVVR